MVYRKFTIFLFIFIIINQLSLTAFSVEKAVRFSAVGDILLDRGIRMIIEKKGQDYPLKGIDLYLLNRDLVLGNLEGPLSERGEALKKKFIFRGNPSYVAVLEKAGINLVSLANNHIMDYGNLALIDTIDNLKNAGLYPFGAGENQEEALKPVIIYKNGLTLSFFAFLGYPLQIEKVDPKSSGPCQVGLDEFISALQDIRDQVDFIIVSLHWGLEYESLPHPHQVEIAHQLIDNGVDLIIGHHPHVIQGIEKYRGKYILYSLGNFLFDQHGDREKESFIFNCDFKEEGVLFPYIIMFEISKCQTKPASEEKAEKIIAKIHLVSDQGIMFFQENDDKYYIKEIE
ncbi:CapA family protein [Atribacter laminatus]|jgi:poly-gamma-glutamate synthesis protein (capsule biosynthesis protein)|uniref:Capsule biosynthesis protein CapA n=1 Tax=Atribacter laminatus TaxID=2847778 RepID=A0A7T1AKS6_ATRLM|nr:CapA family protein [Atribacter laminatus]QPM67738.1 Capsule biosynthesis protein CapA [Atribacter laminatus]